MQTLKQLILANYKSENSFSSFLPVSGAALNQLVNKGIWPKKNPAALRKAITQKLAEKGIKQEAIDAAFAALPNQTTPDSPIVEEDSIMLMRKKTLTLAAKQFFKLPFNFFTEPLRKAEELYRNSDIDYVRESLWQAAKGNSSFIAVVGESGAGKTTLKEELYDRIEREHANVIVIEPYVLAMEANDIKGKTLKSAHIAEAILAALAPSITPKRSPDARSRQIHKLLSESRRAGFHHIIVIEEAHCIPKATLKHLKRFLELKQGFSPLLSVILIGQPELLKILSEIDMELREVVQRCEIIQLEEFTEVHLKDYLNFRCASAGRQLSEFIDDSGIDAIAKKLNGYLHPLAVGNLLTGALNLGATDDYGIVDAACVMEA